MKQPFFARHALLVLIVVFFFVPFAMRGSRYAVQRMKNDVKDWLPADFPETAELDWFRQRFLGEQFVVVSWDGCRGTVQGIDDEGGEDDVRFRKFVDGLFPELPPSQRVNLPLAVPRDFVDENLGLYVRSYLPSDTREFQSFIGNQLNLFADAEQYYDWGGLKEKWIRSGRNEWVYITPKGELRQWLGNRSWPAQAWRQVRRLTSGKQPLENDFIKSFGPIDGPWYYEDPTRLNARLFKSVTTGPSVLSELTHVDGKLSISREQAHDRLRGVLFGPNDKQTCIVVTLTDAAKQDPRALVGRGMLGKRRGTLLDIAEQAGIQAPAPPPALPGLIAGLFAKGTDDTAVTAPMLRLGGPTVDNAAIDEEGQITLARLLGLSLAVGLGLSWLCFRSVSITVMVFLVGGISAVASVGIVYWTGSQLDAVLMSMPSLVYVLGISGAVHVVNYYRESVGESGLATAPDKAVKLGLWPCTMAAFTTSLGLLSLATSNIVPIKKFGCYAAIGVIATLVLLFTYLPAALELFPPRRYLNRTAENDSHGPASAVEKLLDRFWQRVGRWVIGHYQFVGIVCAMMLCAGVYGVGKIDTSVELLKLFDSKAKIIEDYEWLEKHLGQLVPMEIVLRVHPDLRRSMLDDQGEAATDAFDGRLDFFERMEAARFVGDEIERIFGAEGEQYLSKPMMASTFAREKPTGFLEARYYAPFVKRLEESRQSFVDADFLRDDPEDDHELWRISLRLAALSGIDFGDFVESVKRVVEPILLAYEYRENILSRLPEGDAGKMRVYFVGYPTDQASDAVATRDGEQIDQTLIFVKHLNRLLHAEGFERASVLTKAEHVDLVTPADTVIVLNDDPQVSMQALKTTGALRIDARSHEFVPNVDATARQREQKVSAVYTGLVPIVYKAQRTLLRSLIQSTGLAFVMIAAVMVVLLRSPQAGLISMLPNIFPVVAIFGVMGLRGDLVDIGSMMTASVAMGVAVDDTIHFLSWFRRGLDEGVGRHRAILLAYRRVATAMTQTTAIGGIGLSIFAFSTFTPTQRFGTLMLALLAAALVGDLLFLPALLASPLGKIFDKHKSGKIPVDIKSPHRPIATSYSPKSDQPGASSDNLDRLPPGMRRDDSH